MASTLSQLGRFLEPALLILVSLAGRPKHGYAIMEEIEGRWDVRLGPGTLYAALARLEKRGLVEPLDTDDRKRPYRLTPAGSEALATQLGQLKEVAATGLQRLGLT
ncbi:MAG: helix-turn-helix transcriptional regulator [Actinobacteria bacterium]|nr:helix-turn-helix transcriptional regulator [Actinomycetota bacterium]